MEVGEWTKNPLTAIFFRNDLQADENGVSFFHAQEIRRSPRSSKRILFCSFRRAAIAERLRNLAKLDFTEWRVLCD